MSATLPGGAAPDRYAVIGNPVAHSKSPAIHAIFARETAQSLVYERLLAPLDAFEASVAAFFAAGGRGLNVTLPFKLEAFALATRRSPRAEAAGAVNTLRVEADGALYGDNTDGIGLVRDIEGTYGTAIAGARILLLGAGGAARGAVLPLLERRPATLVIANRTAERAQTLVERFASAAAQAACVLHGGDARVASSAAFDIVVNATSGSLSGALPCDFTVAPGALAYDMMYAAEPTVFMRQAASQGARTADGLGMLIEQAAESFRVWRGVLPPTVSARRALRAPSQPE